MKHINLIFAICLFNVIAYAQVNVGLSTGINLGNFITKIDGEKENFKPAAGYIISGEVNIPLNPMLLLQTGLQFESVNDKISQETYENYAGTVTKRTLTGKAFINYINIPAKLFFVFQKKNNHFSIGAGPYIGIGISGASKSSELTETTIGNTTTNSEFNYEQKAKFGSADTTVKRISWGIGADLSYRFKNNMGISIYLNEGLANISNRAKTTTTTSTAGLTLGYIFKTRKSNSK